MKIFLILLLSFCLFAEDSEKTIEESLKDIGTKDKIVLDDSKKNKNEEDSQSEVKVTAVASASNGDCYITVVNGNNFRVSAATELIQFDGNGKRIKGMNYGFNLKPNETVSRTVNGTPKTAKCQITVKKAKDMTKKKPKVSDETVESE